MRKLKSKIRTLNSIGSLGYGSLDKVKLYFGYIFIILLWKIHPRTISLPVSIRCHEKKIPLFLTSYSDFCVLIEVFVQEEYYLETPQLITSIVDAGSNVGFTALYFASRYPSASIFCFEPDPHTFEKLRKNTESYSNIKIFNAGLGSLNEVRTFYVYPHSSISSSYVQRIEGQEELQIPIRSLDDIIEKERLGTISLLKFDIEGYEAELLKGLSHPKAIENYIGEVHFDLMPEKKEWFETYFAGRPLSFSQLSQNRYLLKVGA